MEIGLWDQMTEAKRVEVMATTAIASSPVEWLL